MIKMFYPTLIFTRLQYIHLVASNNCSENIESVVPCMIYSLKRPKFENLKVSKKLLSSYNLW